jgi:hypothetical protein
MRNFFSVPFATYSGEESPASYIKTANKSNDSQVSLRASISYCLLDLPQVTLGVGRQHNPFRITEVSLLNFGPEIGYPESFRSSSRYLLANARKKNAFNYVTAAFYHIFANSLIMLLF